MAIVFKCTQCSSSYKVQDQHAGKQVICKKCGTKIKVPAVSEAQQPHGNVKTSSTSLNQNSPKALQAMKCQSCGGTVQYKAGQGYFECKYCHSRYNSTADSQGNSVVQTLELRELAKKVDEVSGELQVTRLQKNAGIVQDKLDFKYVEFYHSFARKAGSIAVVCWIIGGLLLLYGLGNGFAIAVVGAIIIGVGLALFFVVFKKAQAAMQAECENIKTNELEPIFDRLKKVGATLAGGDVALGYEESTASPLRYCVSCHKNVTPLKARGGGGALSGMNLALTIVTCGAWLPAWFFIALLSKAGSSARRAVSSGGCPQCGTTPLFPARIGSV